MTGLAIRFFTGLFSVILLPDCPCRQGFGITPLACFSGRVANNVVENGGVCFCPVAMGLVSMKLQTFTFFKKVTGIPGFKFNLTFNNTAMFNDSGRMGRGLLAVKFHQCNFKHFHTGISAERKKRFDVHGWVTGKRCFTVSERLLGCKKRRE